MRKMLAILLAIMIMTPNFIFAAGSDNSGGKDSILDITHVNTSHEIVYAWDLQAFLAAEHSMPSSTAEFRVEALRYEKSNELTVFVEAEVNKLATADTVTVELGYVADESFQAVRTFEVSDFQQEAIDGITKLALEVTVDLLGLSEEEIALLQKVRLSILISDTSVEATENEGEPDDTDVLDDTEILPPTEPSVEETGNEGEPEDIEVPDDTESLSPEEPLAEETGNEGEPEDTEVPDDTESLPPTEPLAEEIVNEGFAKKAHIYNEPKNSDILTATHSLLLPDTPIAVNANARIETNLLDVLEGLCSTTAVVDDWTVTGTVGEEDVFFTEEIQISFDDIESVKDVVVNVILKGDDDEVLESIDISMAMSQGEVLGEIYRNEGYWISPIDEFVLSKRSIPVRFRLEEAPADMPMLYIYEADDSSNIPEGEPIAIVRQKQLANGTGGKKAKGCEDNLPGFYYKFILKTKDLSSLEEGGKYILAVMVNDELMYSDENTPAVLTFTVAEDTFESRWSTKLNLKDSSSTYSRYEGYNRSSR